MCCGQCVWHPQQPKFGSGQLSVLIPCAVVNVSGIPNSQSLVVISYQFWSHVLWSMCSASLTVLTGHFCISFNPEWPVVIYPTAKVYFIFLNWSFICQFWFLLWGQYLAHPTAKVSVLLVFFLELVIHLSVDFCGEVSIWCIQQLNCLGVQPSCTGQF